MRNQRIGCLRTIWGPSLQLFVFVGLVNSLFAQSATQETWHIVWRNDGSALQAGPDTNDPADLTQLLNDAQVRSELERTKQSLSKEQLSGLDVIRNNFVNRLTVEELRQVPDLELFLAAQRSNHMAAIEELLLPGQLKRLKEVASRIEIAIVGYGSALDCGRLGELVGVYENQKSRLYDREAKIRAEVELEAAELKSEAEDRILALLTDEQRKKFRLLVGGHFEFQDTSEIQVRAQGYLEKRRKAVLESLREGK